MKLFIPSNYNAILTLKESERAIKMIKDFFEQNLAAELKLRRVTAPLFVQRGTGINDDLNGTERPVSFEVKDMDGTIAEIVHSLAKWKRMMLADYEIALAEVKGRVDQRAKLIPHPEWTKPPSVSEEWYSCYFPVKPPHQSRIHRRPGHPDTIAHNQPPSHHDQR